MKNIKAQNDFYNLHQSGTFLLVNVHDVGSALLAEAAGAAALGTTSGGHAYTCGIKDAAGALTRDQSIELAAKICAAVDIPVSIDAENGWGHSPEEVAETIRLLIDCGAAGASIEDWSGDPELGFYDADLATERIEAAVEAAKKYGDSFVICARADRIMHEGMGALEESIDRLRSFANAGADCVYAPGPKDEATFRRIVNEAGAPINGLFKMGGELTISDAEDWGIRRVSVGSSLYQATMAAFSSMVTKAITTGSLTYEIPPLDYEFIESLVRK